MRQTVVVLMGTGCTEVVARRNFVSQDQLIREETSVTLFALVLRPGQPNGVMSSAVSLPNHTFTGQA